jgi:hypothetical protein
VEYLCCRTATRRGSPSPAPPSSTVAVSSADGPAAGVPLLAELATPIERSTEPT